jgi:hypothetical protein
MLPPTPLRPRRRTSSARAPRGTWWWGCCRWSTTLSWRAHRWGEGQATAAERPGARQPLHVSATWACCSKPQQRVRPWPGLDVLSTRSCSRFRLPPHDPAVLRQVKTETDGEAKIQASYQGLYKQMVEILRGLGVQPVNTVRPASLGRGGAAEGRCAAGCTRVRVCLCACFFVAPRRASCAARALYVPVVCAMTLPAYAELVCRLCVQR